ncbi:MAG: hypothetical protein K9W45_05595 [Candidatus Heimdallarchaeum aukensis]|uniref:Uncharacterized protein n=1 Tax=Candidatus Heimdallarchaeum aukensis TaxID=2876573 RepID=A0A9Y1FMT2_9ARCH|nr:MAG: hypothetical protein K9W45_05595 [Candidatus Heimdallarchaeum aukensis]
MKDNKAKARWMLYPYRLAHHPTCEKYKDHVYTIKGIKVCRGCFNLYLGQIVGLILAFILSFVLDVEFWIPFILTYVLYSFTLLNLKFEIPRLIKDFFRFLLGIAVIMSYLTVILSIFELIKGINILAIVSLFLVGLTHLLSRTLLVKWRNGQNRKICLSCEQYHLPRCEGMKLAYDRMISLQVSELGDAFSDD